MARQIAGFMVLTMSEYNDLMFERTEAEETVKTMDRYLKSLVQVAKSAQMVKVPNGTTRKILREARIGLGLSPVRASTLSGAAGSI